MRYFTRMLSLLIVVCLTLCALAISASASPVNDFAYTISDNNTYITITAYNGTDTEIIIPDTIEGLPVTTIDDSAFAYNDNLTSVTFPETLQHILPRAFEACTSLDNLTFPSSLQSIGAMAFYNCYTLSSVSLSPYTYDIGFQSFHNTRWLVNSENGPVYLGRVLYTYWGPISDNTVLDIADHTAAIAPFALEKRSGLLQVNIPVGLRMIGERAFAECAGLQVVRIPPSVQAIDPTAFDGSSFASIRCATSSYAQTYSIENELYYEIDTTLEYPDGDMDQSGTVDSSDFRLLMQVIVDDAACDHERYLSCDIIYDGMIDTRDLREWMILSIQ